VQIRHRKTWMKSLGNRKSGRSHYPQEELEQHLQETYIKINKGREKPLEECSKIEDQQELTIQFDMKEPTWFEMKEVVKSELD
jgi:formylmethanofuran dehydrogenase subunit E